MLKKRREGEEVHVEETYKTYEQWKDGRPWLSAEDARMFCLRSHEVPNAHKTSHSVFLNSQKTSSGAVSETTAFFCGQRQKTRAQQILPSLKELQTANNGDDILTKHCNSDKQASEFIRAEIINWKQNALAFYQFINNNCATAVEF